MNTALSPLSYQPELFPLAIMAQHGCLFLATSGLTPYAQRSIRRAINLLAHNHPSGDPEPSQCDRNITGRLKEALALVDVNTLDHLVIGSDGIVSFAERGWI